MLTFLVTGHRPGATGAWPPEPASVAASCLVTSIIAWLQGPALAFAIPRTKAAPAAKTMSGVLMIACCCEGETNNSCCSCNDRVDFMFHQNSLR